MSWKTPIRELESIRNKFKLKVQEHSALFGSKDSDPEPIVELLQQEADLQAGLYLAKTRYGPGEQLEGSFDPSSFIEFDQASDEITVKLTLEEARCLIRPYVLPQEEMDFGPTTSKAVEKVADAILAENSEELDQEDLPARGAGEAKSISNVAPNEDRLNSITIPEEAVVDLAETIARIVTFPRGVKPHKHVVEEAKEVARDALAQPALIIQRQEKERILKIIEAEKLLAVGNDGGRAHNRAIDYCLRAVQRG